MLRTCSVVATLALTASAFRPLRMKKRMGRVANNLNRVMARAKLIMNMKDHFISCDDPYPTETFDEAGYEAQSAACKFRQVWAKCLEDELPVEFFVGTGFKSLFQNHMLVSYTHQGDMMPTGRLKVTHP